MRYCRGTALARMLSTVFFVAATFCTLCLALASTTIKAGETLATQTASNVDTATLKTGDTIALNVVEPYPDGNSGLAGSKITLNVTDVTPLPGGRVRVAFLFDRIALSNGTTQPITAYALSSQVVRRGEATETAPQPGSMSVPGAPSSSTIFWQKNLGSSNNSTSPGAAANGGYVYAHSPSARLAAGSPVTVQLTRDLTMP
jgi:hypothetical protein